LEVSGALLALNTRGAKAPVCSTFGEGMVSMPFAFLLTEGIQAFALRLW
jgi:hypothetical protein